VSFNELENFAMKSTFLRASAVGQFSQAKV